MDSDTQQIIRSIKSYQERLDRYISKKSYDKILYVLSRLGHLPIRTVHLEETGIGRTVNGLKKFEGEVGDTAKSLVAMWKMMVLDEEKASEDAEGVNEEEEETVDSSIESTPDSSCDSEVVTIHSEDEQEEVEILPQQNGRDDYTSPSSSVKESENRLKENKHKDDRKRKHDRENSSERHSSKKRRNSKSLEPAVDNSKEKNRSHARKSESSSCDSEDERTRRKDKHVPKTQHHSRKSETNDKHKSKKSKHSDSSDSESDHQKRQRRSSSNSKRESKKGNSTEGSSSKHKKTEKTDRETEKKSNRNEAPEKDSKSNSDRHKKEAHKSSKHENEKKERSEKKDKHVKDEPKKSDHKQKSSKEKSSSGKERSEAKNSDRQKPGSSKHKSGDGEKTDKKSKNGKKEKAKVVANKGKIVNGIDSGSGASFAEALGLCGPVAKSSSKKKSNSAAVSEKLENSILNAAPSTSYQLIKIDTDKEYVPEPLKESQLEPLNINIDNLLPEITPNYRPLGFTVDTHPKRMITDDEALSRVMANKNQKTKVYSGVRLRGKVETLFDLCVRVLQDHIDALEYTGGVPFIILKPIMDKATADQLFNLEHHNPYLIEDTDDLWQLHCQKEFRTKKRQELESWREMYMRCLDEREARLSAITANIKQAQDKSLPVRTTKLAYIDSVAKPPRNVARKQMKNGILNEQKPKTAPKVSSLAAAGEAGKASAPNSGSRAERSSSGSTSSASLKLKKAPLMAKTLSFLKNRFRR